MTIQDVAREAGVSVATVSRVLNGGENVKEDTKKLVNDAMERLKYQPNLLARNLRRKETMNIIVSIPSMVNSFYAKVIYGIENEANKKGYNVMVCNTYNDKNKELSLMEMLKTRLADGLIMTSPTLNNHELLKYAGLNIVFCSEYVKDTNIPYVSIDNEKAAEEITSYLISLGCKRIVHFSSEEDVASKKLRMDGYKKALERADIPIDNSLIVYGNYGYRNSMKITAEQIIDKKPDAIMAIADRMAAGAIRAIRDRKINVPNDIMVTGFDNTPVSYMNNPTITTVSQSQIEMGEMAMRILEKRIKGEKDIINKNIIPYEIIERESTK